MAVLFILLVFLCASGISGGKFVIHFPTVNCKPPIGEDCVEIRKCPYFNDLLNSSPMPRPRNVIDIIRAHQCDFQNNRPYVCCNTTITSPAPFIETSTKIKMKPVTEPDRSLDSSKIHRNFHLLPRNICGQRGMVGQRITNGEETELNEFPWMALIAYDIDAGGQGVAFKCAGTLISERFVLTAAHCIMHEKMIGVRLGEHDLNRTKDCHPHTGYCAPPTQDFFIESFIIHPQYDQRRVLNDIALIKLNGTANFNTENVQPICLPMEDLDLSGKHADVIGWGVTEEGIRSLLLRKVSLPVVKLSVCQKTYQKFAPVTNTQICAGGSDGKDSCGGDSGGPLKYDGVIDGTTRFVQYGIVSYGPKQCGTDGKPGIYTKVYSFMNWILDQLDS